jgi:hypothetical protein
LDESLKVSARLVDRQGQVVASTDAEPVSGAYPTTAWRPGEVVADAYEIPLPPGLPPGEYSPLVIIYEPASGTEHGRALLPPVRLEGSPVRPPRRALERTLTTPLYARMGDIELLGYSLPGAGTAYQPGDKLPLALLWHGVPSSSREGHGQPPQEAGLQLWLAEAAPRGFPASSQIYSLGQQPVGGLLPANRWQDGQVVRQWPVVHIPDGVPAGAYRLKMRVMRGEQPVPWGRGIVPLGNDLDLGLVTVVD